MYEYILMMYKVTFIKGFVNITGEERRISKEYEYSSKQYQALRKDLIKEYYTSDTSRMYIQSESEALLRLQKDLESYNAKANNALQQYDSLTTELDSIINIYGIKE